MKPNITLFISRNPDHNCGGYIMTNYMPYRNPHYDEFKVKSGEVLGQLDVGTWYYHGTKTNVGFSKQLDKKDLKELGIELAEGHCINLTTGEVISLENAPSVFDIK